MSSNAATLRALASQGIFAQESEGFIIRLVNENDDECRRDGVEALINGQWQSVVVASLDWRKELPAALEAVRRGEPPIPRIQPVKIADEPPHPFSDSMISLAHSSGPLRFGAPLDLAEVHPEL